ncbi:glycerate kinase, partial [Pseudomonas putida]
MKIVIAPDSFKDSLDAAGVARAIALGLSEALPAAE